MRVGIGYDVHRLVPGRKLVLGGVTIEHDKGLQGHSDADVVLHAVADAVLGAAGQGDIGEHFPDTDPANEGLDSGAILADALAHAQAEGLWPVNVDVIVFAEAPPLADHKPAIRQKLAEWLGLQLGAANVKAKTAEGLGAVGGGEAIACQAVVLLGPVGEGPEDL